METKQMFSKLEDFTPWLEAQLEEKNLTVTKLAQISGVHTNTIHNYLYRRCEPTLYNARCIIEALGYDLGVIKYDTE